MVFKRPDLRNLPQSLLQPAAYLGEHCAFPIHGSSTKHPHIGSEKIANNRPCFSMTFLRPIPHTIGYRVAVTRFCSFYHSLRLIAIKVSSIREILQSDLCHILHSLQLHFTHKNILRKIPQWFWEHVQEKNSHNDFGDTFQKRFRFG